MQIKINTDNHVQCDPSVEAAVQQSLEGVLQRYGDQLTRIEVHVGDTNAAKKGDNDKRCLMEARMENRPPVVAEDEATTIASAISGSARKLRRAIETDLGKLNAQRSGLH